MPSVEIPEVSTDEPPRVRTASSVALIVVFETSLFSESSKKMPSRPSPVYWIQLSRTTLLSRRNRIAARKEPPPVIEVVSIVRVPSSASVALST